MSNPILVDWMLLGDYTLKIHEINFIARVWVDAGATGMRAKLRTYEESECDKARIPA